MSQYQETLHLEKVETEQNWTQHDTSWLLSLFGTAVGAGILFLPVNLGIGGFWPLIFLSILTYPITFITHRSLARFMLSSKKNHADFTDVVGEHFGTKAGHLISTLYFLSIFPILLIYGVGITNTVDSFIVHQLGLASPPRAILSFCLIFGFMTLILCGEKMVLRTFAAMVYPLTAILGLLSFYLIPNWKLPNIDYPSMGDFLHTTWLAVPVIIFSFSHAAVISTFVQAQKRQYPDQATAKSELILRNTNALLVSFVLLFVFSCVFSLSPEQLIEAKAQNVSVLSYLANITDNPFIETLGPFIAFIAITSSFLGHFLGARESFNGLWCKFSPKTEKYADNIGIVCMFFVIWFAAILNPSILGLMETLSGPVIAMILCVMPVIAIYKVEQLKTYRNKKSTFFTFFIGVLAVSALLFSRI